MLSKPARSAAYPQPENSRQRGRLQRNRPQPSKSCQLWFGLFFNPLILSESAHGIELAGDGVSAIVLRSEWAGVRRQNARRRRGKRWRQSFIGASALWVQLPI